MQAYANQYLIDAPTRAAANASRLVSSWRRRFASAFDRGALVAEVYQQENTFNLVLALLRVLKRLEPFGERVSVYFSEQVRDDLAVTPPGVRVIWE
jgi:hypothetical protein